MTPDKRKGPITDDEFWRILLKKSGEKRLHELKGNLAEKTLMQH